MAQVGGIIIIIIIRAHSRYKPRGCLKNNIYNKLTAVEVGGGSGEVIGGVGVVGGWG